MSGLLGGVLPAIYSQADRAKRYLGGLLSDPVGRMQQAGGQAVDDLNKIGLLSEQAFSDPKNPMKMQDNAASRQLVDTYLSSVLNFAPVGMSPARVMGETAGLLGPAMAAKFAPQIAGGLLQAGDNLAAPQTLSKQAGTALFDTTNLPNRGRDLIRLEAERLAEMLQKNGFAANVEHGGSIAGPSSYLQISDPATGRFFKTPVRLSGHAKGAYNSQSVWDVNSSEFSDVLMAAEKMRAAGKSVTVQMQEHAEKLISEGVKPKAAHRMAREFFEHTQK